MGPLNIVLWLAGVALIVDRLQPGQGSVGALPGAQGRGRQRRPLRVVAGRRPQRRRDGRLGRHGGAPPPGPDRRRDRHRRGRPRLPRVPHPLTRPAPQRRPPVRRHSMAVQRSMTTSRPASWAIRAASQFTTPSCSHRTRAPAATASRACGHAQLGAPEDVDHVERSGRRGRLVERPEGRHAQQVADVRVDRHALEALVEQVAEDAYTTAGRGPRTRR